LYNENKQWVNSPKYIEEKKELEQLNKKYAIPGTETYKIIKENEKMFEK